MAATFPLLNLSPSVSEHVLGCLSFSELFDLAQCSKRTFNMVKASYKNLNDVSITIDTSSSLTLCSRSRAMNLLSGRTSWEFLEARHPKRMDLEDPITYKIDEMRMEFCVVPEVRYSFQFDCLSNHTDKEFLKFCAYIMHLFNAPVKTLNILKLDCLDDLQSILEIRSLETLSVRTRKGKVSHEDMRKILDIDTESLSFSSCLGKNFTYDLPIRSDTVLIIESSWVNAQILRNLDCKNATLYESTLTNEDLNSFLKHWLEGSNTRLEYISASGSLIGKILPNASFVDPDWDLSKIVDGVPTLPGAAKRPGVARYNGLIGLPGVPYENGVDLKRESDGMLATVVLFKDRMDVDSFLFEVWQVPDPNVVAVVVP